MSFIQMNLGDNVAEPEAVDEGTYDLIIAAVTEKESKNTGAPMLEIVHEIQGVDNASPIYHYLVMPKEGDEEKTVNFKLLNLKRYLTMAGIPFDNGGFEVEDFFGASFSAFIVKEEMEQEDPSADPQFRNSIKVPRLA